MLGGAFKNFGGVMLALRSTIVSWTGIGISGIGAGIFVTETDIFDIS